MHLNHLLRAALDKPLTSLTTCQTRAPLNMDNHTQHTLHNSVRLDEMAPVASTNPSKKKIFFFFVVHLVAGKGEENQAKLMT